MAAATGNDTTTDATAGDTARLISFEPPGPGSWMLDVTHHGRRPVTRFLQPAYEEAFVTGMPVVLERYGLPLAGFRLAYVHGCNYVRVMGIGEPEVPKGPPPALLMKLVSRLHPELRRRNKAAAEAWAQRRWRTEVDDWFERGGRDRAVAANRAIQAVDPGALDDAALLDHLEAAHENFATRARAGFESHGGDLVPTGDYLAHAGAWGIDPGAACALLAGASPASVETAELLAPVAEALASRNQIPSSVAQVRALGAEVDAAITRWLDDHGWRLLFSDDLDSTTLAESPDLVLRALLAASQPPAPAPDPAPVRAQVPAEHRALFEALLTEARYGMRLRDDNVGVGWNWPAGLLRRAVLEVGRRLVERGRIQAPEHVLEVAPTEVGRLLSSGVGPSGDELAERWAFRALVEAAEPPTDLGPAEQPPPLEALPAPMRRAAMSVMTVIDAMQGEPVEAALSGTGIGDTPYEGRVRVVTDPSTALVEIDDGDVVVTSFTGPSWNSLLPLVGALVVEEGGPLCHAAIVAREFGIPAVVGVTGATAAIADGSTVQVDPVAGTVRLR